MSSERELTHDEIWDDSALVNSWNDALAEYKKYHSIHARGGTLNETPKPSLNAKNEDENPPAVTQPHDDIRSPEGKTNESTDEQALSRRLDSQSELVGSTRATVATSPHGPESSAKLDGPPPVPGPMGMLGSIQDEGLKKLLMSWYYAGYYTGLYQGQQESGQNTANHP